MRIYKVMRTYKVPISTLWLPEGRILMLTQQWRYRNLASKSFYILFRAKGIISYRQIISSRPYVRSKGICSLAVAEHFETPVSKQ